MKRILCGDCGKTLGNTEIALNLRLRGRAIGTFFCLSCLAERLDCGEETLERAARHYRENGCELFARVYVSEPGREDA